MCGIAGLFKITGRATKHDVATIEQMNSRLFARGPDGAGLFADQKAVLGSRRLAILDLTPAGTQPLSNDTETVTVTFNGEIYNFAELRNELVGAGYRFKSRSDTEVLIHGYEEWNIDGLLRRLRGMFAFALYDRRGASPKLFLCRDRLGIKPLYYANHKGGSIVFASEIKALSLDAALSLKDDPNAYIGYLLFGSVPRPLTTFRDISLLSPGTYLQATDRGVEIKTYYNVEDLFSEVPGDSRPSSPRDLVEERVRCALDKAVELHLTSDAPLGVFLSGGIDSSTLVALASKQHNALSTVGITFDESEFSEEFYQKLIAEKFGVTHHSVRITASEFSNDLDRFLAMMDQPTLDGVNTYFVTKAARQLGLKAVLSGVGGDELFCGYPTLKRARFLNAVHCLNEPMRNVLTGALSCAPRFRKLALLHYKGMIPFYLVQRGLFTPDETAQLLDIEEAQVRSVIESLEPLKAPKDPTTLQQFLEIRHYLTDQLLRDTDVFGMANSVEVRVPFLDHVLMDEVLSVPASLRLANSVPKPLLTGAVRDVLPEQIIFRPKRGFTFPMQHWLKRSSNLSDDAGPVLNRRSFQKVMAEFRSGKTHWSRAWALTVLARSRPATTSAAIGR